ncbi:unnamed protein product [Larinioides sclopetarius]|uniref:Uncharacterized protein n=1 Tax=Larinioides sclopetarius TaxID=280406 RepID=A0AAV1YU69_9ARAC
MEKFVADLKFSLFFAHQCRFAVLSSKHGECK